MRYLKEFYNFTSDDDIDEIRKLVNDCILSELDPIDNMYTEFVIDYGCFIIDYDHFIFTDAIDILMSVPAIELTLYGKPSENEVSMLKKRMYGALGHFFGLEIEIIETGGYDVTELVITSKEDYNKMCAVLKFRKLISHNLHSIVTDRNNIKPTFDEYQNNFSISFWFEKHDYKYGVIITLYPIRFGDIIEYKIIPNLVYNSAHSDSDSDRWIQVYYFNKIDMNIKSNSGDFPFDKIENYRKYIEDMNIIIKLDTNNIVKSLDNLINTINDRIVPNLELVEFEYL